MYANTGDENGANPEFKWNAKFKDSEVNYDFNKEKIEDHEIVEEYQSITGSGSDELNVPGDGLNENALAEIINRLPKTWKKAEISSTRTLNNAKTLVRVANLTDNPTAAESIAKLNSRISNLSTSNSSLYTIIPKIQAAYGFTDLGSITIVDDFDANPYYVTTHKIGYESKDRFAKGENTCNSYLFLSPVNHSEIQVDGDTLESSKKLKSGETLRVPLIYQFRMKDYDDSIFGKGLKETSTEVKNTKYANIIGIDIWTDRNALKPKQYDIIVYSTYGDVIETNTNRTKTSSTQTLINVGGEIVKKLDNLAKDSKTVSIEKNILTTRKSRSIK
jgi:hypothetical protein